MLPDTTTEKFKYSSEVNLYVISRDQKYLLWILWGYRFTIVKSYLFFVKQYEIAYFNILKDFRIHCLFKNLNI